MLGLAGLECLLVVPAGQGCLLWMECSRQVRAGREEAVGPG
jgi:hypothetical protein